MDTPYHCNIHSEYKYYCNHCVESKNYYWMNKRHEEKIPCPECGILYYSFNILNHQKIAAHRLANEIKRIDLLEGRIATIENKIK